MAELRESGIDVLGDISWGSHYSYFYQTTHDLLDTLVPYFMAGLRSKEFCLWIVSNSELLTVEEAKEGLRQAMPDLDRYLAEGSIEIVTHDDWFLNGKAFDLHRVANRFKEKLDEALARGYAGMRVNGSPAWLQKENRMKFCEFEEELNRLFPNERIIASCTFPLTTITGDEIFEITQRHQFAIAKRYGQWEVIETPELKQVKSEIKKLNDELEQRIVERTRQLSKAIGELNYEIAERKKAEDELRIAYQSLSYHVENTPLAVIEFDKDLLIKRWSKRAEEIFGWNTSEALGKNVYDPNFPIIYIEDIPAVDKINKELTKGIVNRNLSLNRNYTKDGNVIYCEWYNSVLRDEHGKVITILSLVHNVTERKKAEETLKQSYEEIRRLNEHLQNIREDERTSIAREIHDELGQQLTAIKMDVAWIDKKTPEETTDIKRKLKNIIELLDGSNQSIRRILSELRPRILNEHGWLEALEWLGRQFTETTGIPVKFIAPEKDIKVSEEIATCIFRVCQEAYTNITRYALAKNVSISINIIEENVILIIEDDGIGFDTATVQTKKSFGILGMKERVLSLGGKFKLVSSPGKGTKITVSLPYKA